ncbi:MAG: hypothetical protein GX665_01985 [Gammaproteobacteria bacterium]|nr:hypothetical protein [Gammaproteobacteria bacterium]
MCFHQWSRQQVFTSATADALQAELSRYQTRLEQHISQQNNGNSTVGDVLGQRNAQIDPLPYLAGSLPYSVKARSQPFSEIPDARRAKFKYEIYPDQRMAAWGDSPVLSWQVPTASIAGKKITLAWVAANEASQKAIEALIPTNLTDLSQLPRSIPSSVQLKPQIIVEGEVKAEGSSFSAGSEPVGAGSFTKYGSNQWDTTTDQLIAGQQTALGVSIQGISQKQLDALKSSMERTSKKLEQSQTVPQIQREHILKDMTGEHIVGDLLTATIWGYFASLQSYGVVSGSQADVIDLPGLQYGLFHSQVRPNKLWGVVTTGISFTGLNIDVGHVRGIRWVKDDNPASQINSNPDLATKTKTAAQNRWIAYNKSKGQYSSGQEHAVLEEAWIDKSQCKYTDNKGQIHNPNQPACAKGVSAVKAIAIAQAQGQKIYTITSENRVTALPKLSIGGSVGAEITNAINAGKEVIFHESKININGWSGHGYIIIDPDTGAGAYIIEGSGNGGFLSFLVGFGINAFLLVVTLFSLLATISSGGSFILLAGMFFLQVYSAISWVESIKDAQNEKEMNMTGIMAVLDIVLRYVPTAGSADLIVLKELLGFITYLL